MHAKPPKIFVTLLPRPESTNIQGFGTVPITVTIIASIIRIYSMRRLKGGMNI